MKSHLVNRLAAYVVLSAGRANLDIKSAFSLSLSRDYKLNLQNPRDSTTNREGLFSFLSHANIACEPKPLTLGAAAGHSTGDA